MDRPLKDIWALSFLYLNAWRVFISFCPIVTKAFELRYLWIHFDDIQEKKKKKKEKFLVFC